MITTLRSTIKSNGCRIAMWVFLVVLAIIWTVPSTINIFGPTYKPVARINNSVIPYADFVRNVHEQEQMLNLVRQQYGQYADLYLKAMGYETNPEALALTTLTRRTLLNQVVAAIPLHVHADYITDRLSIPEFVRNSDLSSIIPAYLFNEDGAIDNRRLRDYLQKMQLSYSEFEHMVEQALERALLIEMLASSVYMPDFLLKDHFAAAYTPRKYALLAFNIDTYLKAAKTEPVDDATVYAYFAAHTDNYWAPERRTVQVWRFNAKDFGITVGDEEVERYYTQNKAKKYVAKPAQLSIRRILVAPHAGETEQQAYDRTTALKTQVTQLPSLFASIADESDAAEKNGGLMPWLTKGEGDTTRDRIAFSLAQDGDISEIFKTVEGFEIVQRIERKAAEYTSIAQVRAEIAEILTQQHFHDEFTRQARALTQNDSSEEALQQFIATRHATPMTHTNALASDDAVMRKAFQAKKNIVGMCTDATGGALFRVTDIQKKYLPKLEAVRADILNDIQEEHAYASQKEAMTNARQALKESSPEKVAHQYNAQLTYTEYLNSEDNKALEELKKSGVPVDHMLQMERIGESLASAPQQIGYVVAVADAKPFNQELYNVKKPEISNAIRRYMIRPYSDGLVASLDRTATIEVDECAIHFKQEPLS